MQDNVIRILRCLFVSALIYLSLLIETNGILTCASISLLDLREILFSGTIFETVLFIFVLYFVWKSSSNAHMAIWEVAFFGLFILATLIGDCFAENNSLYFLYDTKWKIILTLVTWAGLVCLMLRLTHAVKLAFTKANRLISRLNFSRFHIRHEFLLSFIFMLICWLPLALIRYPAGIDYDSYCQIEQFLGYQTMTSHWPPAASALIGGAVWAGISLLGSASIGIFCYVLLQMIVSALILSYTIKVMKTLGVRKRFRYAALLIYGVIPLFSNYLTQVMKDSLYSIFVVLLITLITESLLGQKATVFHMICIGLTAIGVCLLRNNGIYIIYALLIGLILCNIIKRQKIYTLLLFPFIATVIINTSYNSVLLPSLGIQSGSVKEALSIPFQQTARYVKEYPEEVTEEEAYIISEVLDYENLAELYNPDLSDSVKGTYTGKNEMLPAYFRVWFCMFLKHPGVYLEATLNNCYAFFYVNVGGMQSNGIIITTQNLDEKLQFDEFENMFKWRARLRRAIIQFSQLPLISLLCNCGVHFWIAIYLTIKLSVSRHGKLLLLLIPSAIGILVCIAGPTYYNCGLRYALPIIYANPFLVSISGKLLNDYKLSEGELKKCEC